MLILSIFRWLYSAMDKDNAESEKGGGPPDSGLLDAASLFGGEYLAGASSLHHSLAGGEYSTLSLFIAVFISFSLPLFINLFLGILEESS